MAHYHHPQISFVTDVYFSYNFRLNLVSLLQSHQVQCHASISPSIGCTAERNASQTVLYKEQVTFLSFLVQTHLSAHCPSPPCSKADELPTDFKEVIFDLSVWHLFPILAVMHPRFPARGHITEKSRWGGDNYSTQQQWMKSI